MVVRAAGLQRPSRPRTIPTMPLISSIRMRFAATKKTPMSAAPPKINATIHKVNECVRVEEIDQLHAMYLGVMRRLLT